MCVDYCCTVFDAVQKKCVCTEQGHCGDVSPDESSILRRVQQPWRLVSNLLPQLLWGTSIRPDQNSRRLLLRIGFRLLAARVMQQGPGASPNTRGLETGVLQTEACFQPVCNISLSLPYSAS